MAKRILLADDSITIQKVIELTFSDEDFEVVTVGNGRLAVERLAEVRPDVVLCDIIMPERDGYEVCDYVKRHPQFGHVPVLLLTGAFEPFDQERAQRAGADGYLAKPFEPETLIAKVKDLLARQSQRNSISAPRVPASVATPPPPLAPAPAAFAPQSVSAGPQRPSMPSSAPPAPPAPPPAPPVATFAPRPAVEVVPPPVQGAAAPAPFLVPPAPRPLSAPPSPPGMPPLSSPPPQPPVQQSSRLIPDDPFAGLDPSSFGSRVSTPAPAPPAPSFSSPVQPLPVFDAPPPSPEATPLSAEEAASLVPSAGDEDGSATLFFRSPAGTWSQPTIEVPLEERARAALEAQHATGSVFEEIVEEEVVEIQTGSFAATGESKSTQPQLGADASVGFEALVDDAPDEALELAPSAPMQAAASVEDLLDVPAGGTAGPLERNVGAQGEDLPLAAEPGVVVETAAPVLALPEEPRVAKPQLGDFEPAARPEVVAPAPELSPEPPAAPSPVAELPGQGSEDPSPPRLSALAEAWMETPVVAPPVIEPPPSSVTAEFFPLEAEAWVAPAPPEGTTEESARVTRALDSADEAAPAGPEPVVSFEGGAGADRGVLERSEPTLAAISESVPGGGSDGASTAASTTPSTESGSEPLAELGPSAGVGVDQPVAAAEDGAASLSGPDPWADLAAAVAASGEEPAPPSSVAGSVTVTPDMVRQIAQRVIAQVSEKVVREIAWEVIPEIAEALIKREIERLKAELLQDR